MNAAAGILRISETNQDECMVYFSRLGLGVFNAQRLTPGSCFGGKGFGGGRKTSDESMES